MLRGSGEGRFASSSPSQASGCTGWRRLCGWQPWADPLAFVLEELVPDDAESVLGLPPHALPYCAARTVWATQCI